MRKEGAYYLLGRYILAFILALPNLFLFYLVFTPLTIYPVLLLLKLFYGSSVYLFQQSSIIVSEKLIDLVQACIAGSAYYLLLILNLSTPMHLRTRIKSLIFLFVSFLLINIIRIIVFSVLFISGYQYFDATHLWVWYLGSTFLVVCIWFVNIKIFRIKSIPFYTDIKNVVLIIKRGK